MSFIPIIESSGAKEKRYIFIYRKPIVITMSNSVDLADLGHAVQHLVARLRFRHLQMLIAVSETGGLRAAAKRMHLTQPALSKAIKEIESAFGRRLFERTTQGLVPTVSGEFVIKGAGFLLRELTHVHHDLSVSDQIKSTLRLGATPFIVQTQLPEILRELSSGPDGLRVHIMEERVPRLMEALSEGEVDAAITTYPKEQEHLKGFRYDTIREEELTVIASPGHPLTSVKKVRWQTLAMQTWIMPNSSSMLRHEIENCFRQASTVPPVPIIESTSPDSNIHLVAADLGIAVVPEALAKRAVQARIVKRLAVSPSMPKHPVALIYRDGLENPRVRRVRMALGLNTD